MSVLMTDISFDIVTSTDFVEYGQDLYAAEIDGLLFELKVIPAEDRLLVSMGAVNALDAAHKLFEAPIQASNVVQKDRVIFSDFFVSVPIPIDEDWLSHIKECVHVLISWAKADDISSGCFLCGNSDGSVFFRKIGEKNTYICDQCVDSRREDANLKAFEKEHSRSVNMQAERFMLGLVVCAITRILLSFILVPVASYMYTLLLVSVDPSDSFMDSMTVSTIICFLISFVLMRIYKKAAGSISLVGIGITTGIGALAFFLDYLIIFPLALRQAFQIMGIEIASSYIEILQNADTYLSMLSLDNLQLFLTIPPFFGLLSAMLFEYLLYKREYS